MASKHCRRKGMSELQEKYMVLQGVAQVEAFKSS